jgi:hypothetical protein
VRNIICPSNVTSKDGFVALKHRMSYQYVCTCQQDGEFSFLQKKRQHQQMLQQQSIMAGFSIWTTFSWDSHNSVKGQKEQMCT